MSDSPVSGSPFIAPDYTDMPVEDRLLDLTDQVAAVTGAANGIGRAVVRRLEQAGATVIGLDRAYSGEDAASDANRRRPVTRRKGASYSCLQKGFGVVAETLPRLRYVGGSPRETWELLCIVRLLPE